MSYPFSSIPGPMSTPPSYSCGYDEPYACRPPVIEDQSSGVLDDLTRGVVCIARSKQTSRGKAKMTRKDVCPYFHIDSLCSLLKNGESGKLSLFIQYGVQGTTYKSFIPADAVASKKYRKHMPGILKYPAASNSDVNDVIDWKIATFPDHKTLTLFDRQGYFLTPAGTLVFVQPLTLPGLPSKLVPEGVQNRRQYSLDPIRDNDEQIIMAFGHVCSQNSVLRLAGLYMVTSLFRPFFPQEQWQNLAFLNYVPRDKKDEQILTSLLSTNDLTRYTVPELGHGAKALEAKLNQVCDGVAVVVDHSFADEKATICEGTKVIIQSQKSGRRLIASISDKVSNFANQLDEGCCISVPVTGELCTEDIQAVRMISTKLEAVLINRILPNQREIQSVINTLLPTVRFAENDNIPVPTANTITILTVVADICQGLLHCTLMSKTEISELLEKLCESTDLNRSADELILEEFARSLSEKLRNGSFTFIQKRNRLTVDASRKHIVVYGERLYIPQQQVTDILSVMQTTMNKRNLVNALKRSGVLNATDGNTHPLDAHDITGAPVRLYCYDVSAHILDADVRELMQEPESAKFFMSPEQLPDRVFLSLVSRFDGRIAGRQIRYCDATNNNIAIWGQSGVGKSFLMMQLMKRAASMGHRVIVFDSSDSFSADVLRQELSSDFVDAHVAIYELDELEIPVDLFRIDRTKSRSAQGTMLLGSICAGIPELSPQQKQLLRKTLNDVLEKVSSNEPIRPKDICTMLDKESPAYKGLLTKLEPLFYTIEQLGMADRSWKAFFTKEITVIRMNASFTEHGNALFDMLTASLYNAQCEDPSTALDVFIDELQNQNLSRGSAIHKILTEGRKKNTSFCGATQDYYPHNTELGSTMGKADTQVFFKPTFNSVEQVAKELRFGKADRERLDNMTRGVCFIKGSVYNPEIGQNAPTIISGTVKAL